MTPGRRAIIAGHRYRQAHERLLEAIAEGEATRGDVEIMASVAYWHLGWGKYRDDLYLGQIAHGAGRWIGDPKDCPQHIRKDVGRRLKVLVKLGVLEYEPGRGRGVRSTIVLPPATAKRGAAGRTFSGREKGRPRARKGVPKPSKRGALGHTLPRVYPRDNPLGAAGPAAAGSAGATPAAAAAASSEQSHQTPGPDLDRALDAARTRLRAHGFPADVTAFDRELKRRPDAEARRQMISDVHDYVTDDRRPKWIA